MSSDPKDRDDPLPSAGYGRPPVEHQIRQGEVRNPHGRAGKPKPKVDFLDEIVSIGAASGERRQMTRRDAIDHFLFASAAKGKIGAIAILEARARQRQEGSPEEAELSGGEKAAFDRFVRRYVKHLPEEGPT